MEDDQALLQLYEWCERTLEELSKDQPTTLRHDDGTLVES